MSFNFNVLFLGTGVSTAIPNLRHVLDMNNGDEKCSVCNDAIHSAESKNKRNNVSIAILYQHDNKQKCVLIDAGKTMREACLTQLPKHCISEVNAILITHGHADAMMGLDDVRDLQKAERVQVPDPTHPDRVTNGFRILSGEMPIYVTKDTMTTISSAFPYLCNEPCYLVKEDNILSRRIALLKFTVIEDTEKVCIEGLNIQCFPVWHGGKYVSLGFSIGKEGEFVYISDVKLIPQETWDYLKAIVKIKVLVLDALDREGIWSHCGLYEAIDIAKQLQPEKVLFTGMCCEMGLHEDVEKELASMGLPYHLAFDGLVLNDFEN